MEFFNYDNNGSLLDVYKEDNKINIAQNWKGAWGTLPSTATNDLLDGKPSMLGYHNMRPVTSAAFWIGDGNELYNPAYKRNMTQGTDDSGGFVFSDNNPLINGKIQLDFSSRPGQRNLVYWATVLGIGAVGVAACTAGEAAACFASVDAFKAFTLYYGVALTVVGLGESAAFCSQAYKKRRAGLNYDVAAEHCVGALSVLHTGGRIALSGLFSGDPWEDGITKNGIFGSLVGSKIEVGAPTINQSLYLLGFTAINAGTSLAGAGARGGLSNPGAQIPIHIGIALFQGISDVYTLPWLKRIGIVNIEEDSETVESVVEMTTRPTGVTGALEEENVEIQATAWTQRVTGHKYIGQAWKYRYAEIPFIYAADLAARRNLSGPVTGKDALCQLLSTFVYQGIRIGVANLPPGFAKDADGVRPSSAGSTIGRAGAAGGGNLLAFNKACVGQYDSVF
jgi:hypothetical protein